MVSTVDQTYVSVSLFFGSSHSDPLTLAGPGSNVTGARDDRAKPDWLGTSKPVKTEMKHCV